MAGPEIGERIARWRRRRGLSQVALAGLVGRSESWLSQVERGRRGVDSLAVLREIARVLRVDLDDLAPPGSDPRPRGTSRTDPAIEMALFVPADADRLSWPAITGAHTAYQDARYGAVLDRLPALIAGLAATTEPSLLVAGWTLVAKALSKVGSAELATIAADRAVATADRQGDRADLGMATYQVVAALLPTARSALAEELATRTADALDGGERAEVWSVTGALWLIAAVAAARRGDAATARARLDRAQRLADLLGRDANLKWTAFGPTNVAVHRVSVAAELGDAASALAVAERLDPERFPSVLRGRRVQAGLDLAWAYTARRRDAEAMLALLDVERVAPEVPRHNIYARTTIMTLLGRARGGTGTAVRALAARSEVG